MASVPKPRPRPVAQLKNARLACECRGHTDPALQAEATPLVQARTEDNSDARTSPARWLPLVVEIRKGLQEAAGNTCLRRRRWLDRSSSSASTAMNATATQAGPREWGNRAWPVSLLLTQKPPLELAAELVGVLAPA